MNKYNRITLYKERSESFTERTVSLLEQIDFATKYNNELHELYNSLVNYGYDGDEAFDQTRDFSASLADEYMLLSDGMYSAVLTGIFHLWERDIKDFCKHMLRYKPVAERDKLVTEQEIHKYNYGKLISLLIYWGASDSIFDEINILRLVVNTIKHSTGPSTDELLITNFKYYKKLEMLCNLNICDISNNDELEMLVIDDIKFFGKVVSTFWQELGKSICI